MMLNMANFLIIILYLFNKNPAQGRGFSENERIFAFARIPNRNSGRFAGTVLLFGLDARFLADLLPLRDFRADKSVVLLR